MHVGAGGTLTPAVRGFNLDVTPYSLTGLMGPSGCGKTTLLRIIGGLDKEFRGRIDLPPHARIGFVFQDPRLLPWRTVRQNIELVSHDALAEPELQELAATLDITDKLEVFPLELSLGLARRASIARAFATRPDLLLLDEPFVSLDEPTADRLRRLLIEVWSARPTTAMMVTHNPREAIQLADTLVLLAPRPTYVVEEIPIEIPRDERTPEAVEAILSDLSRRFPANFQAVAA